MNELIERIADLLINHFIEMKGGLLVKLKYLIIKGQIHLTIGNETLVCNQYIDNKTLIEALKKAYSCILGISGIPEVVESIEDLGDHFNVNVATIH